jgi:hypothetical protein
MCGAAGFSAVVEVTLQQVGVMHWISPPSGWFLLYEARLRRGTPLIHARCATCMQTVLARYGRIAAPRG